MVPGAGVAVDPDRPRAATPRSVTTAAVVEVAIVAVVVLQAKAGRSRTTRHPAQTRAMVSTTSERSRHQRTNQATITDTTTKTVAGSVTPRAGTTDVTGNVKTRSNSTITRPRPPPLAITVAVTSHPNRNVTARQVAVSSVKIHR